MESSDEDDDRFLYGSDEEEVQRVVVQPTTVRDSDTIHDTNDSDVISESESDSDIEFIISNGPDPTRLDSQSISLSTETISVATESVKTALQTSEDGSSVTPSATTTTATNVTTAGTLPTDQSQQDEVNTAGNIDLDKDGLFDGQPITQIDPEVLKEKPWRQPGANLADYFNYGFNEFSWMEYLDRQEKIKTEYNPRRILMGLLTLQQQGKLDPKPINKPLNDSTPNPVIVNTNKSPPAMPPPGFPPLPMFGGFPPFPMPGMIPPMNQQQQQQQKPNQN
ncbi:hypothetical protein KAFR_0G00940 [Kazachstania africana CBS 2517]|uniref:Pre-mRNA polyadenylation factor FIP1 n=1 Tax=Kazachstania africana (strain ATCC 22294 / BCRC 22015 / CBS 2517 / CECT 1963 / NBRC 1671 / NRRL Y-8276) TaxID=1071382 RepID=H2AXM7_KAZAF|nr:hypothetical protein KAFR_0G00940 [Kazachstania africana CBS 2517]CCF59127.1 hypothetical protein KAFR_0G00940 [Kazachstania africana CBS 2517]